jgi:hypothetical protein
MKLLLLLLGLCFFVACEQGDTPLSNTRFEGSSFDPLMCDRGGPGCDMRWLISFNRAEFPDSIVVMLNNQKVFSECDRDSNGVVERLQSIANITLWNYVRLENEGMEFKLKILKEDCLDRVTSVFYELAQPQAYKLVVGPDGASYVSILVR